MLNVTYLNFLFNNGVVCQKLFSTSTNTNNSSTVTPVKIYGNADLQKQDILKDQKGKSGIYRWTNILNGKSYVGSSNNLIRRLYVYYNAKYLIKYNLVIYKALLKYGYANFSFEILEFCPIEHLIDREQYYLDLLQPEYNTSFTAGSPLGYRHTNEALEKMSQAKRGNNHPNFGKNHSQETRQKMSEAQGATIFIYDLQGQLIKPFSSSRAAAKYLNCSDPTIMRYARSGKVFKNKYQLSLEELLSTH